MRASIVFSMGIALPVVSAYLVAPPGVAAPGTTSQCSAWVAYSSSLTCASIEESYGISSGNFASWNPIVVSSGSGCSLLPGLDYCVQVNFQSSTPTTTTVSTTSTPTTFVTTTSGDGISTPSPVQTGIASNCDKFYLVQSGDQCGIIASNAGISLAQFYAWNPAVGSSCQYLYLGDYVCIDVIGATHTTTAASTTTTPGNGITTPTPYQAGMTSNCDKFYLVQSGDQCGTIASNAGVSLSDFYSWNPAVGSSCAYLYLGDYVCIGVIGASGTTTTAATTTTPGNGITTPTPYQSGMASNCNKFYLVQSGDQCGVIASNEGISLSQFYAWNPAVGSACQSLYLGDYVCVDVIGVTPTTKTSTSTSGNGITTPTPYQPGMVSNCDKFYLVQSGDQCGTIATKEGISLANFYAWNPAVGSSCAYLYLGDYVCVGVTG
ncbi:hypothetical protein TCE0_044r17416 [Talaromyces pinophilus]|uniref:LysM domain-containing protein n=1 Tax=Talaromyces pinophilus TaxID=128442 RepID=A0A478EE00_TALPI|nr:hypothetical protein TCE0_044r17416 [Talaromyces pinophilus]